MEPARYVNAVRRKLLMRQMGKEVVRHSSVISNNCTAGIIFNDLGLQHLSPTVDSLFTEAAFLKYCQNLEHYCSLPLEKIDEDPSRKVTACLGDIQIRFIHDANFSEVREKWQRRTARIDFSNISIIYCNPSISSEGRSKFAELPFSEKCLLLVDTEDTAPWEFSIHSDEQFEKNNHALFEYMSKSLLRYYYQMDIPLWLNSGVVQPADFSHRRFRKF